MPLRRYAAFAAAALFMTLPPAAAGADETPADTQEINPRYVLVGKSGRAVTNEDFPGRFQLITFGYTFCPDICPTTLAAMTQILGLLDKQASRLQPIFVSVDPERDTAETVARYTGYFDPRILGLTGTPELVRRAADHFKVSYQKYAEPGAAPGNYSVDHSAGMYLLGPDGDFVAKFAYVDSPQKIAVRIGAIMAATAPARGASRR